MNEVTTAMEQARAVADAVLYEGYLLYPYRASAAKNKVRWQWGVLMPPACAAAGTGEHAAAHAELIAEPPPGGDLHLRLRFLHLQHRVVEVAGAPVGSVTAAGVEHTTWEEAVEREVDAVLPFAEQLGGERTVPFTVAAGEDAEPVDGLADARIVRRRAELHGELRLSAEQLAGPFGGTLLRLTVANTSTSDGAVRQDALRTALIAAHVLLAVPGGSFLSLIDPPEWASVVTAELVNEHVWPVLVGGGNDTVLCSPIILYDQPAIAEQSQGTLYDGLEIDEILTLRTMTLTEEEKRQARATDPRAAELIDRVDTMPPELLDRLHGTVRYLRSVTGERQPANLRDPAELGEVTTRPDVPWWDPGADAAMSPETDTVQVDGVVLGKGSRVVLRPGPRADAHDMFLAGKVAVVQAVLLDVDGDWHLAVTLADDLGAELYAQHGRYRYFRTGEVEPLVDEGSDR